MNNTTKEKFHYGQAIPAPWNSSADSQIACIGKTKEKNGKGKANDEEDDKRHDQKDKEDNALPDAMLFATWDWETHDFRQSIPHHKHSRMGSLNLHSFSNSGTTGVDGVAQPGGPLRKNSIKISKAK